MSRRQLPSIVVAAALALSLASCGGSDAPTIADPTTTDPTATTLLETGPITLPDDERPTEADADAIGYEVAGTGGVWINTNGSAVVVDCDDQDPDQLIRTAGIPGYSGSWTCA